MHRLRTVLAPALFFMIAASPSLAWDAHGHRTITLLALDGLPADTPTWLQDPVIRERIAYQSTEPDHWRGINDLILSHENSPDHYIDLEKLEYFGLTPGSLPHFRYEYLRDMAIAKHEHPENVEPYNEKRDSARNGFGRAYDRAASSESPGGGASGSVTWNSIRPCVTRFVSPGIVTVPRLV